MKLKDKPILHYMLSHVIRELLYPLEIFEFETIRYQLSNARVVLFNIDDYVLSVEIQYTCHCKNTFSYIGRAMCNFNKFELLVDNKDKILSLDFIHHNIPHLLVEKINTGQPIPQYFIKYLSDLKIKTVDENKKILFLSDLDKLIAWAKKYKISKEIFPFDKKEELLSLTTLDLSNLKLDFIPKHIRILKNLEKLYLANNKLCSVPLEIFTLKKLKILWLQENYLNYIPSEINNCKALEELVAYDNNIQSLPIIKELPKLKFVALHRNRLKTEQIKSFTDNLSQNIQCSKYDQRLSLPFFIEPLSAHTLKEAEQLRNSIFKDIDEIEKLNLVASLDKEKYRDVYIKNEIDTMKYWIARDKQSLQVIGLTGIYKEIEDEEHECWLGWFCVQKKYRGLGFGKKLLKFSEEQAISLDKNYLYIYTYNTKYYKTAIEMYKKFGYKSYVVNNTKYKKDLYFKKDLRKIIK